MPLNRFELSLNSTNFQKNAFTQASRQQMYAGNTGRTIAFDEVWSAPDGPLTQLAFY